MASDVGVGERFDVNVELTDSKNVENIAMAAWYSGIVSACGVMGREIEARLQGDSFFYRKTRRQCLDIVYICRYIQAILSFY
jgi:hypothetical protein